MVSFSRLNLLPCGVRISARCQLFLAMAIVLSANSVLAEQQFPYVAYVTKSSAYVRSGPGQRYYPTQQLPQGHAVEVYRHDAGGWCSVRPPEGSFSVVAAHQVNQLGQGLAQVSAEQTVTRVGSLLSADRSAIQVLLPRGEQIKVLDSVALAPSKWVKIAPPAGEFRWIAAEDLSPQPPIETTPLPQTTSTWSRQSNASLSTRQGVSPQPSAFDHLKKSPRALHLQTSETVAIPSSPSYTPLTEGDANAMDIVAGSPAELQLAQFQSQGPTPLSPNLEQTFSQATEIPIQVGGQQRTSTTPRIRFHGRSAPIVPATARVAELELRLSEIIIRSPAEWHFDQLKSEASTILAATDLPGERTRLRDVLDRIARFEQVQLRYTMPPTLASLTPIPKLATASPIRTETPREEFTGRTSNVLERVRHDLAGGATLASKSAGNRNEPLYDATGILKPVVSKQKQAPRFALVDDKGEVVSFVTPTPDLNLQPYLGQRIGVHGTREYMQEFKRAHVTAGRITPIEGRIRR